MNTPAPVNSGRDEIYDAVDLRMTKFVGKVIRDRGMGCLYWMWCTMQELSSRGITCTPQCGSLSVRIIPKDLDDGKMNTHYSFQWSPHEPMSVAALKMGCLPEIHCWVGIISTQEIVDMSVHYIPRAVSMAGFKWQMPPPPKYLWVKAKDVPEAFIYEPDREATLYAMRLLQTLPK